MKHKIPGGNEDLIQLIINEIAGSEHQAITFARFMGLCLYEPDYGYYTSHRPKIGKDGDFYTSSSIGTLMGDMLAKYCAGLMDTHFSTGRTIDLVEWGGGNGYLAKHLLDELKIEHPEAYARTRYISVEESGYHRNLQQLSLAEHAERVQWLSADEWFLHGDPAASIIFANELLDAFPVHRVMNKQGLLFEIYVAWDEKEQWFVERYIPAEDERLLRYIQEEGIILLEGQRAEINLAANEWISRIGNWLSEGVLITIDYGDEAQEIYAAHRMQGTLLCYRQHQAYDDPYSYIGEQDITAHVNFSACINAGQQAGFRNYSYVDQKTFLIETGIMEKLKDHTNGDPFHPQAKINRAIRQLLWSDQMSELFKVLIQFK